MYNAYEEVSIEIIYLSSEDVIATSGDQPFDGEDSNTGDWT